MKFAFIHASRRQFPVRRLCQVLGVSPSGYYAWCKRPPSRRWQDNQQLLEKIRCIHKQSRKTYGSPRVHAQLRKQGVACSRKRVAGLMRRHQIQAQPPNRRVRTTQSGHGLPVAANVLGQDFSAQRPNEKWVSDLTYIPTREGWLYLAAVLDLFSRQIVGWAMGEQMTSELVLQALHMALKQRNLPEQLLHHSDQGSQYASAGYRQVLAAYQIQASMSGVGNCYDNAVMESFFATLKTELVHRETFETRAQARRELFAYIEGFYNRERLHSSLNYQSPVEFERAYSASLNDVSI
jgi:transposase InsO family protein